MVICLLLLQIVLAHAHPKITTTIHSGTTSRIKEVFNQRCLDYFNRTILLSNHTQHDIIINCNAFWSTFKQAWAYKDPCQVKEKDYAPFFALIDKIPMTRKILFWSGFIEAALEFTFHHKEFVTMEKTLLGYLTDDLIWCGCTKSSKKRGCEGGINYRKCDPFGSDCSVSRTLWSYASRYFIEKSKGAANIMLNREYLRDSKSFFKSYQLPEIIKLAKKEIVTCVNVHVVLDWAAPPRELKPVNLRLKCVRRR